MLQEMFIRWEREKAASGSSGPDKNGYQRNMSSLIAELRLGGSSDEPGPG
jgi:hypothetical protein